MSKRSRSSLVAILFVLASGGYPTARADGQGEITHLLDYIAESRCIFIRNGDEHEAAQARDHIRMKYDYAKKKIKTTEDFIKYTATKSSLSGALYRVSCAGTEMPTGEWLTAELGRFRGADR